MLLSKIKIDKKFIILFIALLVIFTSAFGVFQIKKQNDYKNRNKIVNIVFTTDQKYTEYTKVAILSAIMNKNEDSVYNINILCVDIPKDKEKEFNKIIKDFSNVNLKTIPLKMESLKGIGEFEVKNHVSRADLFKFYIPDLFPELDKILYMDGDILVYDDLTELYNTDVSNAYVGAVKRYEYQTGLMKKKGEYFSGKYYTYNCGVLLYNLKKWRESDIKHELIKAKNDDFVRDLVTQRSFNEVIPIEEVVLLSPIYNLYGRIEPEDFDDFEFKKIYKPFLRKFKNFDDLIDNAVIIHYAGKRKPWTDKTLLYAEDWWYYANIINPEWKLNQE